MIFRNIIGLVVASLLLVSCGERKPEKKLFEAGFGYCGNPQRADLDLALQVAPQYPGNYKLSVVAVNSLRPGGEWVRVAIASANLDYEIVTQAVLLKAGAVLFDGYVSREQLQVYDRIIVATYSTQDLMSSASDGKEIICAMPSRDTTVQATYR